MSFFSIFLSSNDQFSLRLRTVIAQNNVLHLVEVKLTKKILTVQIWAKIGREIKFLAIVSSLVHSFSFKLHRMIPWKNIQLLAQVKSKKKQKQKSGGMANLGQTGQNQTQNQFFFFFQFLKFGQLVFLEIAQSDSLEQCLTTSRGKTNKKYGGGSNFDQTVQFWAQNCTVFFKLLVFL